MKKTLVLLLCICALLMLLSSCKDISNIMGGSSDNADDGGGDKPCEHNVVVDEAVEATCTSTGLTEGSHCGRCGEVLTAQEEVPALGHTEVIDADRNGKSPYDFSPTAIDEIRKIKEVLDKE